jgi:nitroreductase
MSVPGSGIGRLIRGRRSIQNFVPGRLPPRATIEAAVEHAIWAPNHRLTEPWRFCLIGPETAERICLLNADLVREAKGQRAAEMKLQRWREMPGWLLLSCPTSDDRVRFLEDYAACCCAAQNLQLYLWEQDIGMKWTTGDVIRSTAFFDLLGLDPARDHIVGLFWYGYPAAVPEGRRGDSAGRLRYLP